MKRLATTIGVMLMAACDAAEVPPRDEPTPPVIIPPEVAPPVRLTPWSATVDQRSPKPPPKVVTPPPDLTPLCRTVAQAACRIHVGCRVGVTGQSLSACEEHVASACGAALPGLATLVAGGKVAFSEPALTACAARLNMLECASPTEMMAGVGTACDGVLRGLVGRGESCVDATECGFGTVCVAGADGSCPGTCEPPAARGDACGATWPCAAGLVCDGGECVAPKVAMGEACMATVQCPADGYCHAELAVCAPRLALGATCDDDDVCPESAFCKMPVEELPGVCTARLAIAATCDPLIDTCAAGLACDEGLGLCVKVPNEAGDGCVADAEPCGGGTGLTCDAGLCELEPLLGDACDEARPCRFGTCVAGTCEAFQPAGAMCERDTDCGALYCRGPEGARTCSVRPDACHADSHALNLGLRFRILP